ncbi:MAG TPA: hypothetical protein VG894_07775 [Bauldia sp.]|nr:hypothetical protein [Bauldia sp.]
MPAADEDDNKSDGGIDRLRVDGRKVDVARLRLAAIDRAVFAAGAGHAAVDHDEMIRRTVNMLFGHG